MTDETLPYRHDAHKMRGKSHEDGDEEFDGIAVNEDVPHGADADAARMSRPGGEPDNALEAHTSYYRIGLVGAESSFNPGEFTHAQIRSRAADLLRIDDGDRLHRTWLDAGVPAGFNETPYRPHTSLKYHTLLVAALWHHYRRGYEYGDLHLAVTEDEVETHATVYRDDEFTLTITPNPRGRPAAELGESPSRSWAYVWQQLPEHPLDTSSDRWAMMVDAQLRRIKAWSTALQFIEDAKSVIGR